MPETVAPDSVSVAPTFLETFCDALCFPTGTPSRVRFAGSGQLPSAFAVTDFAAAAIGAAGLAVSELIAAMFGASPEVLVDRRLASGWFGMTIRPVGWSLPPVWDPIAGDYEAHDGWIRLHTNAPHHREAALAVLGVEADKAAVADAVRQWDADALETAVVARDGCAAAMRSLADWAAHPQGAAVASEPIILSERTAAGATTPWTATRDRPLHGLRVLDCTRVLAGPVATRFLAGFGAEVLRIDPPDWDEGAVIPEVTLGKSCARLDLKTAEGRERFAALLAQSDVFVHGYRPGSLDRLGLDAAARQRLRPGLIDVSLDAYGWNGPWAGRRGFDSLVQMSAGVADKGMQVFRADRPKPLPVQALDHAAGYVMAAAVLRGLALRLADRRGFRARTSLARMALALTSVSPAGEGPAFSPFTDEDCARATETTAWGLARRLGAPLAVEGAPMAWRLSASPLGSAPAEWPAWR